MTATAQPTAARKVPFPGATARVRSALRRAAQMDALDVAIVMTLLVILLHSSQIPDSLARVMAVAGLVHRPLARSPWFWLAVVWVRVLFQIPTAWWSIDNHQYLITWWCLALGLGLFAERKAATLAISARLLIGLCFAFATFWKLFSPEFPDGTFLQWTMIRDARFEAFGKAFLGLPEDAQDLNRAALRTLQRGATPGTEPLISGPRVGAAAVVMSWWTILIEAAVAIAFLWRSNHGPARWRGVVLLAFIVTIYPIAPVVGFAWVLIAMAVAALGTSQRPAERLAFLAVFVAAPAFSAVDLVFDRVG